MTIRELIEELEDLAAEHGDQVEVRLAQQPRWAFEYSVGELAATDAVNEGDLDEDGEPASARDAKPAIVYIGEGSQLGYLPADGARALGWGRVTRYLLVDDGAHHAPRYFKELGLGIFWVCSGNAADARKFPTRAQAAKMLRDNGKHREGWRVIRWSE